MTETIKVEVDAALAKKFRKRAMENFGFKKGAMKSALEEAMRRYVAAGEVDWRHLRGSMKSNLGSVELQHAAWKKLD